MEEEYRIIEGFENYSVSNLGNVKNNITGKMLKPYLNNNGYLMIRMNGKHNLVHRLIANAFIQNSNNKPFVDHIDTSPLNNNISNLRWATAQENQFNSKLNKSNKCGYKGVYYEKSRHS